MNLRKCRAQLPALEWAPDALVAAVQTGRRIEIDPRAAAREVEGLLDQMTPLSDAIGRMDIDRGLIERALAHLDAARRPLP